MHSMEIICDGWSRRHVGAKGIIVRKNHEHIYRAIEAIRRRYDREVEVSFE